MSTVELRNDDVLGLIMCEIFTVIGRLPDYSSNLCPPKRFAMTFSGVFWASFLLFFLYKSPKHPLKSHIANVLGGHRLDE